MNIISSFIKSDTTSSMDGETAGHYEEVGKYVMFHKHAKKERLLFSRIVKYYLLVKILGRGPFSPPQGFIFFTKHNKYIFTYTHYSHKDVIENQCEVCENEFVNDFLAIREII